MDILYELLLQSQNYVNRMKSKLLIHSIRKEDANDTQPGNVHTMYTHVPGKQDINATVFIL